MSAFRAKPKSPRACLKIEVRCRHLARLGVAARVSGGPDANTMSVIRLILWTIIAGATGFIGLSAATADVPSDPPEFYFTRLAYTERPDGCCRHRDGGFGFGFSRPTMPIPRQQYVCPEFGGGRFFPPQGWGWGTDYPGGDCKFMGGIHRLTGLNPMNRTGEYHVGDGTSRRLTISDDASEYVKRRDVPSPT